MSDASSTMATSRDLPLLDTESFSLDEFKSLHISTPLEASKYSFISMFLSRALNLSSDTLLLDSAGADLHNGSRTKLPVELLPHVAVPADLWLVHDIVIRALLVKIPILREVNALLLLYAESLRTGELFLIDEALLVHLENQIVHNHLFDYTIHDPEPPFESLAEVEEFEEHPDEESSVFLRRSVSLSSGMPGLSRASSRSVSNSHKSFNRISSFSRELVGNKRKTSLISLPPSLPVAKEEPSISPGSSPLGLPVLPTTPQFSSSHRDSNFSAHSIASGLLSKSRIYNMMKKRRELANLVTSLPASVSSANSTPSTKRKSHPYDTDSKNGLRVSRLTAVQKAENQRQKHEYYLQVKMLGELTHTLVGFLGKSGLRANLMRLMEFIKNCVFKFILVDICHMIVDYGHYKLRYGALK